MTYEYCLLGGVNDGAVQAHALADLLTGSHCHVNLIPYNPVPGSGFQAPDLKNVLAFCQVLEENGIQVTRRVQRGPDINAACGQLRYNNRKE